MKTISKNKGGRPPVEEYKKKTKSVMVRFSQLDYIYVSSCADDCGLRVSEYCYRAAMQQQVFASLTKDEMTAVRQLHNIGNNLNQITRKVHLGENMVSDIQSIINFITAILRKLR